MFPLEDNAKPFSKHPHRKQVLAPSDLQETSTLHRPQPWAGLTTLALVLLQSNSIWLSLPCWQVGPTCHS